MAKLQWKAGTLLAPVPAVLVTCRGSGKGAESTDYGVNNGKGAESTVCGEKNGKDVESTVCGEKNEKGAEKNGRTESARDNVFTVAWTGIVNTQPPMLTLSVRKERFSHALISESGEFAVNLVSEKLVRAADFCGVKSGREIDKFDACGLTRERANAVGCPLIAESPLSLECRVRSVTPLGSHDLFLAEILCADVQEELVDGAGKLHLESAGLAAYAHGEYFALGRKLGSFGFSVRKKKKAGRKSR